VTAVTHPAVSLSSSSLSFSAVGVGRTATQALTITDTGTAPLQIASSSTTGSGAPAFGLSTDHCTGATVAPGANCTVDVAFTPTTGGSFAAQLAFVDNASGSPHTIELSGSGAVTGTITGNVVDHAGAPVAGAAVQICPKSLSGIGLGGAACSYTSTDSAGAYTLSGLTPGAAAMQVQPATSSLLAGSAIGEVVAGTEVQNFTLDSPRPLTGGVEVAGSAGDFTSGMPTIYWNSPFSMTFPLHLPNGAPSTVREFTNWTILLSTTGTLEAYAGARIVVSYDAGGKASVLAASGTTGAPAAHAAFISTGLGEGAQSLLPSGIGTGPQAFMDVPIGQQTVQLPSPNGGAPSSDRVGTVMDLIMGDHGAGMVDNFNTQDNTKVKACTASGSSVRHGAHAACSEPEPEAPTTPPTREEFEHREEDSEFDAYIDPSGQVLTTAHVPVAGAKVLLTRSSKRSGRFARVPNGSSVMSPANRRNPDRTSQNGGFGWDVLPGFYRVTAQHAGCHATKGKAGNASTPVLAIPPPALNLTLTLRCRALRRRHTRSRLTLRNPFSSGATLLATAAVKAATGHGHPSGVVVFRAGGQVLATVPVSRAGLAVTAVKPRHGLITASYSGDGVFTPSRARATAG
jgi:hypothetical protein